MTIDDSILALLNVAPLHLFVAGELPTTNAVFDGYVDADETTKVISVLTPYVLYFGKRTEPINLRAGGRAERGSFASLTCVGSTRTQADWLADRVEAALDGKAIGKKAVSLYERDLPQQDPEYSRPGGLPLFCTGLRFTV